MKDHSSRRAQKGATLIVGLIMLVLITMMVVSALLLSSTNSKAVGNMQYRTEALAAAQSAIETVISSDSKFISPTFTVTPTDARGISVTVAEPRCTKAVPISADNTIDPNSGTLQQSGGATVSTVVASSYNTYWDVQATAKNLSTGAEVMVHQGVKLILPNVAGESPCP